MANKTFRPPQRFHYLINKDFQLKYTSYLVTSALLSALIVGGPTYYFLNQNYNIFLNLAYALSPDIVHNLTQEKTWITGFFIFSLMTLVVFHIYFGVRLTFRMVGPILALRKHIDMVTRGHLYQRPLHVRQDDEFHDLIQNYNYLYKTLRAQNSFDVKKLESLKYYLKDPQSLKILDDIIDEKESQINDPTMGLKKSKGNHHVAS
jgi:succinate dehydrogenase/fumarate reductase cytochrome b subunit